MKPNYGLRNGLREGPINFNGTLMVVSKCKTKKTRRNSIIPNESFDG